MNDTTTDAASLFAPLWKRKWLILAVAILVAAGTYTYYKRQPAVYTAKTQLYLGAAAEQQNLVGGAQVKAISGRTLSDQVELINSSVIGEPVHKRLREEKLFAAARGKAKATASAASDFIIIATEARTPVGASALANTYAQFYIKRQRSGYVRTVKSAIANARQQLRRIETPARGRGNRGVSSSATIQAATLQSKITELEASLSTGSGVQQVGTAKASPLPLSPTPKKNAIFGFVLGLLLASVAAYALSRLDRRLRSLAEAESIFAAQILTALPSVKNPVVRGGLRAPAKSHVEPLRRLHTSLQMGDLRARGRDGGPRSILFVSAYSGDGRSTVIASLARVQCDAGERVAVIDADLRRPVQAKLFDVSPPRGLAEVLSGTASIHDAIQPVDVAPSGAANANVDAAGVSTVVGSRSAGSLAVIASGGPVGNPPALLAGTGMRELLSSTASEFDYVLIDAPPPLEVSDVMPLLQLVDGVIIVVRVGHTAVVSAERLAQLLSRTATAPLLGLVANCVPTKDIERYGFALTSAQHRLPKLIGR